MNNLTNDVDAPVGMTPKQFKEALPKQIQGRVSVDVMNQINGILTDPEIRDQFRDNLLSATNVIQTGRYKLSTYVDAVRYVSFKLLGYKNKEAYTRTFPNKITQLVGQGMDDKGISSYISAYNGGKLVNLIYEQTLTPVYIVNADVFQKAVNKQAWLMNNALSETVQQKAADSLMTHLKQPEVTKMELDISVAEDKSIQDLRATTAELVAQQKELIKAGHMTAQKIAHTPLTDTVEAMNPDEIS